MCRNQILVILSVISAFALYSCGKPEHDAPEQDTRKLTLSTDKVYVEWDGGSFDLKVEANFEYRLDIQVEWIEETTSDNSSHTFNVAMNQSVDSRSAVIKVIDKTDRYYYKTLTVNQGANPSPVTKLAMVDKDATASTKALYANLWEIAKKGSMFGHHDDLWYGRYWYNEPGGSDTKAVCGDYPAVVSVDFGPIMDNRFKDKENEYRRRVILEARERGEVIMACCHLNNPQTGKDSWDNSRNDVVKNILTEGSVVRKTYMEWLDRLADFALDLKDSQGEQIPVILRIYHEHTQNWSWWGTSCCTAQEFVALWQMTVKYLRDIRQVHTFIYAISPQMDAVYSDAKGRILSRWAGDDYVDFFGMDCYHGTNYNAFSSNLEALHNVSIEKMKPCGVTETGLESFTNSDYWTKHILNPMNGKRISMVVMWRNKYVGSNESDKHYFSVYPGHPSEEDFKTYYNDDKSIFSSDLPDMYTMPEYYEVH